VPIRTYRPSEIPERQYGRKAQIDDSEYVAALKQGQAVGDGETYRSSEDARRACVRIYSRIARRERELGLARPEQRVWQHDDGSWRWALIPR
jgi:hypothetical protein